MKTLVHSLLIMIMLVFVGSAEANSSFNKQVEFIAEITGYITNLTTLISNVDATSALSCSETQEDILNLYSMVSVMELPEDNTPIYETLQYCYLNALDYTCDGLDTNLSLEERIEAIINSQQCLSIINIINANVIDLITN